MHNSSHPFMHLRGSIERDATTPNRGGSSADYDLRDSLARLPVTARENLLRCQQKEEKVQTPFLAKNIDTSLLAAPNWLALFQKRADSFLRVHCHRVLAHHFFRV